MSLLGPIELLAPAGDGECLRAAVANGADAIYLGLDEGFNARARAANFSLQNLPESLAFAHDFGVKIYVTLNTLAFVDELSRLEQAIRTMCEQGVDALLIQDFGLARLVKAIAPTMPIHASTQMSLTSSQGIRVAESLGIERVVLARELSLDETARIQQESSIALEAFVHGALCVAYSGQCLTSESLGGRSANRGECAQACRLSYQLICDEEEVDLGDQKYLLSPLDLAAYHHIPQMLAAGVRSFKIEGRLKTPEYVANITRQYRRALDAALAGTDSPLDFETVESMELSFSRGFSPGWLEGCDHKRLVPGLSSAKRGVRLGHVTRVTQRGVCVALERGVKRGDGVAFAGDREHNGEQGGRVYETFQQGRSLTGAVSKGEVELTFGSDAIRLDAVVAGQAVWKTDDPELNRRLRRTFTSGGFARRVGLSLHVIARVGAPLAVHGRSVTGIEVLYRGAANLQAAHTHPVDQEQLVAHLGRLGATHFELTELTADLEGEPMVALSVLGEARRNIVEQLKAGSPRRCWHPLTTPDALARLRSRRAAATNCASPNGLSPDALSPDCSSEQEPAPAGPSSNAKLWVLCRTVSQLTSAAEEGADGLYADFADIRQYGQAAAEAVRLGKPLYLATPRIQKPDEYGLFRAMARHKVAGFLARNLGAIAFCQDEQIPWIADFSLNAANDLTCAWLGEQGALRVTASYDLNRDQLVDLAKYAADEPLEAVLHQHMPMFHMEHCVFCAVLSPGTNKHNCGRPCDVHQVRLRDRVGMEHPLTADVGCRNTLYNAIPQSAAEAYKDLSSAGVNHFRVELLETTEEVRRLVRLYRQLLDGRIEASQVWRGLRAANRVGVTRGTLEERRNPLAIL